MDFNSPYSLVYSAMSSLMFSPPSPLPPRRRSSASTRSVWAMPPPGALRDRARATCWTTWTAASAGLSSSCRATSRSLATHLCAGQRVGHWLLIYVQDNRFMPPFTSPHLYATSHLTSPHLTSPLSLESPPPSNDGLRWVKDTDLPACPMEMREFVATERRLLVIPCRGDVDMIMGGPPCQGVRNRQGGR